MDKNSVSFKNYTYFKVDLIQDQISKKNEIRFTAVSRINQLDFGGFWYAKLMNILKRTVLAARAFKV